MTKIMIIDEQEIVRTGLAKLLEEEANIAVTALAGSGESALKIAEYDEPDLVLMDIRLPSMGGLETIRKFRRHYDGVRIIVITAYDEEPYPSRVVQAGAMGYITKYAGLAEVVKSVRVVMAGQYYITPYIAQAMALKSYNGIVSPLEVLSERELQVMTLITQCHKVQDIANQLYLSPKTINTYRYRIYDKLNISSDVEMAVLAMRYGIVDSDDISTAGYRLGK